MAGLADQSAGSDAERSGAAGTSGAPERSGGLRAPFGWRKRSDRQPNASA